MYVDAFEHSFLEATESLYAAEGQQLMQERDVCTHLTIQDSVVFQLVHIYYMARFTVYNNNYIEQQLHWTTNFINLCWHRFVLALILVDFVKYKVMWILQIVDINRHLISWICLTVKSMKIGAQRLPVMMLL